jgi:hypothetical protein
MASSCAPAAGHLVAQQLRALAHGGERRLQLVRHVAQEAVLLGLDLREAAPQPVEALPQNLQVLGAAHADGPYEVGRAELADRGVELGDRDSAAMRRRTTSRSATM